MHTFTSFQRFSDQCKMADNGDLLSVIEEDQISTKDLLFLSNEVKAFNFKLNTSKDDMGKRLEVNKYFHRLAPVTDESMY